MKVKNIMFSGFMAVVLAGVCGAASAAADMTGDGALVVASKGYVDAKVTTLNSKDTELSGKITALEDANKAGGAVANAIADAKQAGTNAQGAVDTLAGKMDLTNADSDLSQALATKENTANKIATTDSRYFTSGKVTEGALTSMASDNTNFPTVGAAVQIADAKASEVLKKVDSNAGEMAEIASTVETLAADASTAGSVANQVKAEADRATQAEADLAQAIADEKSRAEGVEEGLQAAIDAINNGETGALATAKGYADEKVAAEKSRAEAAEAKALSDANAYTDSQVSTLTTQTADNTGAIAQLRTDVNAAGVAIDDIAKEGGTIDQKVSALETKLMDETNGTVTEAIKAEADRAKREESRIEGLVTAEANRADAAEKANAQAIADEKSRAEGKEAELATAIADETSRAELAEQGLQNAINTINDGTNGIYAMAKQYTDAGLTTIYSNASECIAASQSNNCILSARTGTGGKPEYVWIALTAPAE